MSDLREQFEKEHPTDLMPQSEDYLHAREPLAQWLSDLKAWYQRYTEWLESRLTSLQKQIENEKQAHFNTSMEVSRFQRELSELQKQLDEAPVFHAVYRKDKKTPSLFHSDLMAIEYMRAMPSKFNIEDEPIEARVLVKQ